MRKQGARNGRKEEKSQQPAKNKEERNNEDLSRDTRKKECSLNLLGGGGQGG
jgi:hypothetical protein